MTFTETVITARIVGKLTEGNAENLLHQSLGGRLIGNLVNPELTCGNIPAITESALGPFIRYGLVSTFKPPFGVVI